MAALYKDKEIKLERKEHTHTHAHGWPHTHTQRHGRVERSACSSLGAIQADDRIVDSELHIFNPVLTRNSRSWPFIIPAPFGLK